MALTIESSLTSAVHARERDEPVVDAEQHDAALGPGQLGAPGEARLAARGVDHDVVLARRAAGAEALTGARPDAGGAPRDRRRSPCVGPRPRRGARCCRRRRRPPARRLDLRRAARRATPPRPARRGTRRATSSPSGKATSVYSGTTTASASPPSTKMPRLPCSGDEHRCVWPPRTPRTCRSAASARRRRPARRARRRRTRGRR